MPADAFPFASLVRNAVDDSELDDAVLGTRVVLEDETAIGLLGRLLVPPRRDPVRRRNRLIDTSDRCVDVQLMLNGFHNRILFTCGIHRAAATIDTARSAAIPAASLPSLPAGRAASDRETSTA